MERNSWNTLDAGGVDGKSISSRKGQAQEPWEYRNPFHGDDLYSGFSWPPRSYTCSFCKREFRSAQALGGHMNVHRRDRARLRQSPPWESHPQTTDLHPNPNQSFSTFSPSTKLYKLSSMHDPSIPTAVNVLRDNSPVLGSTSSKDDLPKTMNTLKDFMQEEECSIKKGKKLVLDLEIGVGSNVCEDLDLELRLGYS